MTRRCSHCSNNGHNSGTCPTRGGGGNGGIDGGGVKLFGVRLTDGSIIKKSASMGNLSSAHYHSSSSAAASPNPDSPLSDHVRDPNHVSDGYLSDDPAAHASTNRRGEREKGVPWTEEEHRLFLIGLQKLGKGDWRRIARNFVMSRTPTQVASHAQKYFIRQSNVTRRKRCSSLFDMVPDDMYFAKGSKTSCALDLACNPAYLLKTPSSLSDLGPGCFRIHVNWVHAVEFRLNLGWVHDVPFVLGYRYTLSVSRSPLDTSQRSKVRSQPDSIVLSALGPSVPHGFISPPPGARTQVQGEVTQPYCPLWDPLALTVLFRLPQGLEPRIIGTKSVKLRYLRVPGFDPWGTRKGAEALKIREASGPKRTILEVRSATSSGPRGVA
ncbi:hypothetical protein CRYUN_Cryun32bG0089000 [Craigia yunnanensis]